MVHLISLHSFLVSIAREGDIVLPLELCLLRRGETFSQSEARAQRRLNTKAEDKAAALSYSSLDRTISEIREYVGVICGSDFCYFRRMR